MKTHARRDDTHTLCGLTGNRLLVVGEESVEEVTCKSCLKYMAVDDAPAEGLTEERVREIVRDELENYGVLPALLKAQEVADVLSVSSDKVRDLAKAGKLASVRMGKKTVRYAADSVDAYIRKRQAKAIDAPKKDVKKKGEKKSGAPKKAKKNAKKK